MNTVLLIRLLAAILAVLILGVIVYRRKKHTI